MAVNDNYAGWNFHNNFWTTATTTSTIQIWPSVVDERLDDDHLLTDMEWLDAEVDEIRELAFAA